MRTKSHNSASGINADKSFAGLRSQLPVLIFLALIFFVDFTARIIFSPLMPTIEADLNLTHSDAGLFFLLISFGYFIGMLGSGLLSAAVTHKKTISLSAIAVGLTLLPIAFSSNKWILLIGSFLGIYTMLPLYLVTEQGMGREMANTLVAISRIPGLALVFLSGWATDRFGPKRTRVWIYALTGILTMGLGLAEGVWTSVFVFAQWMIAVCFPPAALVALSLIGTHETRNIAVSLTIPFAFLIGGGLLPILIGIMGDAGAFGLGIVMVGALIILASILPHYLIFPQH